jgi:hypothetical protein
MLRQCAELVTCMIMCSIKVQYYVFETPFHSVVFHHCWGTHVCASELQQNGPLCSPAHLLQCISTSCWGEARLWQGFTCDWT